MSRRIKEEVESGNMSCLKLMRTNENNVRSSAMRTAQKGLSMDQREYDAEEMSGCYEMYTANIRPY